MTTPRPSTYVALVDLARDLGVTRHAVRLFATKRDLPMRTRKRDGHHILFLHPDTAAAVRAHYATSTAPVEKVGDWWMTAEQAAAALGITVNALKERRHTGSLNIEIRRLTGTGGAGAWRYNPRHVASEAARLGIRPQYRPRGTLMCKQVAALLDVKPYTVRRWLQQGAPHGRLTTGYAYIRPADLLTWLEKPMRPHTPRPEQSARLELAAVLRAYLTEQQKGAA